MNKNILVGILILIVALLISGVVFIIFEEESLQNQIIELKEIALNMDTGSFENSDLGEYLQNYIIAQNEMKNLWWHTIINQSGLSIIFTAIILIISFSMNLITQSQIEKRYDEKMKENNKRYDEILIENNKYSRDIITDYNLILEAHQGSFGAFAIGNEVLLGNYFSQLNSYQQLKVLSKEDFKKNYYMDLKVLGR